MIFLCAHDPFDDGIPVYTLERMCRENGRVIDTGAHWLVFNCRAYDRAEAEGLRNLLEYLENGRVPEGDALLRAMDEAVIRVNADRKWVSKVLSVNTVYDDARTEGLLEGRAEGREEGFAEGRAEGRVEGRAEGRAEGEERLSKLVNELLKLDRISDIERITDDVDYREKLFGEFEMA